jgi:hypothetical protein
LLLAEGIGHDEDRLDKSWLQSSSED